MGIKEDLPLTCIKEASLIVKETTKEKIVIIQCMNSEGLHQKEDQSLPGIKIYFRVIVLRNNFGHKVVDCKAYGRNVQASSACVSPHNIECYKCHNYRHMARNLKSMIDPSIKEKNYNRYNMVWKRKERK